MGRIVARGSAAERVQLLVWITVFFVMLFMTPARVQEGAKCIEGEGGCGTDRGSPIDQNGPIFTPPTNKQNCLNSCNIVYTHCLGITYSDVWKEDCNRKQHYCTQACE